jgi:putative transposase
LRVARELDAVIGIRGRPAMIVSDNGTEFTSMAMLRWSQERQVEWHYIAPGKPQQNGVDHHSIYLRDWLNQAGVTEIEEIRFQPTLLNPDPEGSFAAAVAVARFLAARA